MYIMQPSYSCTNHKAPGQDCASTKPFFEGYISGSYSNSKWGGWGVWVMNIHLCIHLCRYLCCCPVKIWITKGLQGTSIEKNKYNKDASKENLFDYTLFPMLFLVFSMFGEITVLFDQHVLEKLKKTRNNSTPPPTPEQHHNSDREVTFTTRMNILIV